MMSSQFLQAIFLVISSWLIWFFVFVGLGILIRWKFFNLKIANFESLLSSFWIGWAYTIFFLQLWNLYFKIDWRASLLVCMVGVTGLIWNYKDLLQIIKKGNFLQKIILSTALSLIVLWIADFAILSPMIYDGGLYHLPSISWLKSYPIIPGLGNLFYPFAFNHSSFLYAAILDFGPWIHKSQHLANGLILSVLIIQIFLSGMTFFRDHNKISLYHIFYILFLGPVLILTVTLFISTPSPDMSIYILGILVSANFLTFLEEQNYVKRENEYNIFFIVTLAALGITIKLSFAAFGVFSLILLFIFCIMKNIRKKGKNRIKKILFIYVFCLGIALIPWMIRGITLSGYVAYPSTIGGVFPVDWRIPYITAKGVAAGTRWWIISMAGQLDIGSGYWSWILPWIKGMFKIEHEYFTIHVTIPLFLIFINSILIFFSKYLKKYSAHNMKKNIWLFLLPSACAILFWFSTIPEPRYIGASFWILGVGTTIIVLNKFNVLKSKYFKTFIISFSIILFVGFFFLKNFVKINIPEENNGFYKIPSVELKIFETNSGLNIYVPEKGDQCWDATLPCTPTPNADLRLRREGEMRYGFKVNPTNK